MTAAMTAASPRKRCRRACGVDSCDKATVITTGKRAPPAATMIATSSSSKRRRRCARTALATVDASPPDVEESLWECLPPDLVLLVGSRLLADAGGDGLLDYVRFRAVCGCWRSSTVNPRGRGVLDACFYPTRWVMLPEGHGLHPGHGKLRGYVRFFNLSTGAIVSVKLPLFHDHCILDSVDGLLLLQRDHDTAVRLFNPLTGDIAELPPLSSIPPPEPEHEFLARIRRVNATCIRVSTDGTITVMIVSSGLPNIAFATAGDHQWRLASWKLPRTRRPFSLQGKLYLLLHFFLPPVSDNPSISHILQIDMPRHGGAAGSPLAEPPLPKLITAMNTRGVFTPYLMTEVRSEIMVVGICPPGTPGSAHTVKLFRLADLAMGGARAQPARSIGSGNVLLVGWGCLVVSTRALPNIAGDSVVTAGLYNANTFHLGTSTWSPASDVRRARDASTPPAVPKPLSLIYHLYTCCYRNAWNKGGICFEKKEYKWRVKRKWRNGV